MKKHIWKRITQTGAKLLLSIFALLLVLTGCDMPALILQKGEETNQLPTEEITQEKTIWQDFWKSFPTLDSVIPFFEEYKKINHGKIVAVNGNLLDSILPFVEFITTLQADSFEDGVYIQPLFYTNITIPLEVANGDARCFASIMVISPDLSALETLTQDDLANATWKERDDLNPAYRGGYLMHGDTPLFGINFSEKISDTDEQFIRAHVLQSIFILEY